MTLAWADIPWGCDIQFNHQNRFDGKTSSNSWYVPWAEAMDYYDIVYFARRIPDSCRVEIPRAGLGDYTCPPLGMAKLWNNLHPGNKKIRWVQGSTHGYTPPAYEGRDFFREEP